MIRRMPSVAAALLTGALGWPAVAQQVPATPVLYLPYLEAAPTVDGDLSDWRDGAFSDGVWDLDRLRHEAWYQPARNRLTDHGTPERPEPGPEDDLAARYYTAWDDEFFYMGAVARDNANDVADPEPAPQRWYFRDAICWFVEAPRDAAPEAFRRGDNAFCFVIDAGRPSDGAWWRHGTAAAGYVEEPLPAGAVDYALRLDPDGRGTGDFVLEARVRMAATFAVSDPDWRAPRVGDEYGLEIVHTDPDGGAYGGHFIIYGTGDDDATWARAVLRGPTGPVARDTQ